jgi:hypothetical protein
MCTIVSSSSGYCVVAQLLQAGDMQYSEAARGQAVLLHFVLAQQIAARLIAIATVEEHEAVR